jgi:multiple sugar transport system permease protein
MAIAMPGRRMIAWRRNRALLGGLVPAAGLLSLFFIAPAVWAIYYSFTNRALVGLDARYPRHVGWANYDRLIHSPAFTTVLKNSLVFVVGSAIIGQFILGLALAILLDHGDHRGYRATPFVYGTVLLAWVNPTIIAGFLWVAMFDFYYGSLNKTLAYFGFGGVSWLGTAPMLSLIIANTWRGAAFVMIIFQGALRTIPSQVYEAARMDGASAWQRFWDHTLPNLRQVAALVLLSITISTFGAFFLILTLTNGGPGTKTEVIALYAYHAAFQSHQLGYGSAIASVMLGLNLIFALIYLRDSRPKV